MSKDFLGESIRFSVIVCTRNRANELRTCLPELAKQARDYDDVEVIIVDNGSTDNTAEVVSAALKSSEYRFRYIYEPVPGLCQARNRGRLEARGEVLAYIDDDAIVKNGWLSLIRQHFNDGRSECLGGKVSIKLGGEMPFKLEKDMEWFFMASQLGESPRMLSYPQHPTGCNMCFTTEVFDSVGGFNTKLKLYGDETDFFKRVSERGYKIFYDPRLEVSQYIPKERLMLSELRTKSYKWGEGAATNWLLLNKGKAKLALKFLEYFVRINYIWLKKNIRPSFGAFFTYWYNRGYLHTLYKGLPNS